MNSRLSGRPIACATVLLLIACHAVRAQSGIAVGQLRSHQPAVDGAGLFVAPHASGSFGPLLVGGELELAWGRSTAWSSAASVGWLPADGLRLSTSVQRGSTSARAFGTDYRAVGLAIDGRRAGIALEYQVARSDLDQRSSERRGTELRAWSELAGMFVVGASIRTATVGEYGEAVDERRYVVAGYEFVGTSRSNYLHIMNRRDLEAEITARLGTFRVTGVVGHAMADQAAPSRTWAWGRLAVPLPRGLELLAEAGRNGGIAMVAREPGSFVRVGLRFDVQHNATMDVPHQPRMPLSPTAAATTALVDVADGTPRLLIHSPDAHAVEVKGDFTAWQPRAMTLLADGTWAFPLPPGVLRFNIRTDGGSWTVPAGVSVVADEFSGAPVAVVAVR